MAFLSILPLAALGAAPCFQETFVVDAEIPDNDLTGISDTQMIAESGIASIQTIEVELTLSGGWLGDLYAFLQHESGFSVLLNRVGRTAEDSLGSPASAFDATFVAGEADVHTADSPFTGLLGPDARETDPLLTLDTDPRTADFASFIGLPADGEWTLFIADVEPGDFMTLDQWSLNLVGIPEPRAAACLGLLAAGAAWARRRRRGAELGK